MSEVRLYADEDAAEHAVVDGLRQWGIDVLTVLDVGTTSATDEDQLAYAANEGRSIYTLNVDDYCRLHGEFLTTGRDHAGIIVNPRQRHSIGEKIRRLAAIVDHYSAEEMMNRLEYI